MPGGGKGGGSSSSTVTVNNGPVHVDSDSTVDIVGLDHINVTARLEPTPFKTEARQELILPQPLRTESKIDATAKADVTSDSRNALSVDLKPIVLDVCSTTSSKLPHGQISQPFNLHFGLTWFGMELLGFNLGGQSQMILEDLPKKPAIDWPAQQNAAAYASSEAPCRDDGRGLRVRIK